MDKICGNCKFFEDESELGKHGMCHYGPPTIFFNMQMRVTSFPEVNEKDWCGKFEDKKMM